MKVVTRLHYLRIAPRKVRLVTSLIRKKKAEEAKTILNFTNKKGAKPLLKLLETAIADARNNFQLDSANLYISKITVDQGPIHKRWRPRSRGMVHSIQKKTSHITLVLDEITPGKKIKKVKKVEPKVEEVVKKEKPKFEVPKDQPKTKTPRGLKRFFRRKAF
jgi:large subunit ribosomal protein L22